MTSGRDVGESNMATFFTFCLSIAVFSLGDSPLKTQDSSPTALDLISTLREADSTQHSQIVHKIEELGREAIPALVIALDDKHADIRRTAAACLSKVIHADDRDVIMKLTNLLKDPDTGVRSQAAVAIGNAHTSDKAIVGMLCELLDDDPEEGVRCAAAVSLCFVSTYSEGTVNTLANAVQRDKSQTVRRFAVMSLRMRYSQWIIALVEERGPNRMILPSDEPDWAKKLREIVVPVYVKAMADEAANVRQEATEAFCELRVLAPEAIPDLLRALSDESAGVRAAAARGLASVPDTSGDVLQGLIRTLNDKDEKVWRASAASVGGRGTNVLPDLLKAYRQSKASSAGVRASIAVVAQHEQDRMTTLSRSELEDAIEQIQSAEEVCVGESMPDPEIRRAVQALKAELASRAVVRKPNMLRKVLDFVIGSKVGWLMIAYSVLLVACLAALWLSPDLIRYCSDSLKATDFSIPYINITVKLRDILIVGLFVHHRCVLDAWVRTCLPAVQKRFEEIPTVKQRNLYVNVPVICEGRQYTEFCARELRPALRSKGNVCLLIVGQGGAGKTSLACQIGRWAMDPSEDGGLTRYPMLPVLIEDELEDLDLIEAARGKLQSLSGESSRLSKELFTDLLAKKRVLVMVDHYSELTDKAQKRLRPITPDFPVAALVVTSRNEEKSLGQWKLVEPVLLTGTQVSDFVKGYLRQLGEADFFGSDEEFFDSCRRLTRLVGKRTVTPLLAKLYIEQLVKANKSGSSVELPDNIPSMILRYLDELQSDTDPQVKRQTQADAMTVAWLCIRDEFAPATASRDIVLRRLDGTDAESRLRYLETTLHLVVTTGSRHDRVRFVLDPLVEYLGAMKFIEMYKGNGRHWKTLLRRMDRRGNIANFREFLLALIDACAASDSKVPGFVPEELATRSNQLPQSGDRK